MEGYGGLGTAGRVKRAENGGTDTAEGTFRPTPTIAAAVPAP